MKLKLENNKHLIIGSNSFLGRELSKQLNLKKEDVIGVYHNNTNNLYPKIKHYGYQELFKLKDNYTYVYIISSYVPTKHDENIEAKLEDVNVVLVKQILKHFKSAKIIFCSSVSVYGETNEIITEKSDLKPISAYAKSKMKGENLVSKHTNYGIVRISSMFGKRMKPITFLPLIIKSALTSNQITLFGNGKRQQNYIHVKRVAEILIKTAFYQTNDTFFAVNKKSYSNTQMAAFVSGNLDNLSVKYTSKDESKSYIYNNSYTTNTLALKKCNSIKKDIKSLVKWMKKEY